MVNITALNYPFGKDDIIAFVKKHHYTRRCPGVWSVAYAIPNGHGSFNGVAIYGPPPYPSVARAFCVNPEHVGHLIWQSRMVGAGISSAQLDELMLFAAADLAQRGYWWQLTTTDPKSRVIDTGFNLISAKGFTGDVYQRNRWQYIGVTKTARKLEGFIVDGKHVHIRQGKVTLTLTNVHKHYPDARSIRTLYASPKQRWVQVLGNEIEQVWRARLMTYRPVTFEAVTQPRLLIKAWRQLREHMA